MAGGARRRLIRSSLVPFKAPSRRIDIFSPLLLYICLWHRIHSYGVTPISLNHYVTTYYCCLSCLLMCFLSSNKDISILLHNLIFRTNNRLRAHTAFSKYLLLSQSIKSALFSPHLSSFPLPRYPLFPILLMSFIFESIIHHLSQPQNDDPLSSRTCLSTLKEHSSVSPP